MQTYDVAIIGLGYGGRFHEKTIREGNVGLRVDAIVDNNPNAQKDLPVRYPQFSTLNELVKDHQFDAAIIALPTDTHLQAVKELARNGIPMLLEKPMALTTEDSEKIKDVIGSYNARCMVGLTGRFHPEFTSAYESMQEGDIGEVVTMQERINFGSLAFGQAGALRKYCKPEQGGVWKECGIHTTDRFNYFSDSRIIKINSPIKSNKHFGEACEDYAAGIAVMENGWQAPFSLRFTDDADEDYVFQLTGTNGMLTVRGFKDCVLTRGSKHDVLYGHDLEKDITTRHLPGFKNELQRFAKFLEDGETRLLVQEGVDAQRAVELFYAKD